MEDIVLIKFQFRERKKICFSFLLYNCESLALKSKTYHKHTKYFINK